MLVMVGNILEQRISQFVWENNLGMFYVTQPIKIDLDKNLDPKQKTIQAFNIDANFLSKSILMCGVCFITFCFSDRWFYNFEVNYEV